MTNLYWNLTYFPRCLILLAKHRILPHIGRETPTMASTLIGIAKMQVRPHWLRG